MNQCTEENTKVRPHKNTQKKHANNPRKEGAESYQTTKEINLMKSELQKRENYKRKPKKSMSKRNDHDN